MIDKNEQIKFGKYIFAGVGDAKINRAQDVAGI